MNKKEFKIFGKWLGGDLDNWFRMEASILRFAMFELVLLLDSNIKHPYRLVSSFEKFGKHSIGHPAHRHNRRDTKAMILSIFDGFSKK